MQLGCLCGVAGSLASGHRHSHTTYVVHTVLQSCGILEEWLFIVGIRHFPATR